MSLTRLDSRVAPDDRPAWERRSLDRVGDRALRGSHEVVLAAHELMREGGLEAIRLRPILERAGISRRTFYERFESMDHVLLALFEDTMADAAQAFRRLLAEAGDALEKIEIVLRAMASQPSSPQDRVYKLAMTAEHVRLAERHPEELRNATAPLDNLLEEILEEGMKEGSIRTVEAGALANTIHILVAGVVHRNIHLAGESEYWIDTLCDFCLSGIRARSS